MVSCPASSSVISWSRISRVVHRLALFVAGGDQHREDVVALARALIGPTVGDLRRQQLFRSRAKAAPSRRQRRQLAQARDHQPERQRQSPSAPRMADQPPSLSSSRRLSPRRRRPRAASPRASSPACSNAVGRRDPSRQHGDLALRRLLDHALVSLHPRAVEGRHHQLAPAPVVLARRAEAASALPEQLSEHQVPSRPRSVNSIPAPKAGLDRGGVGDEDQRSEGGRATVNVSPNSRRHPLQVFHRSAGSTVAPARREPWARVAATCAGSSPQTAQMGHSGGFSGRRTPLLASARG